MIEQVLQNSAEASWEPQSALDAPAAEDLHAMVAPRLPDRRAELAPSSRSNTSNR